jgi:hypothetical protein
VPMPAGLPRRRSQPSASLAAAWWVRTHHMRSRDAGVAALVGWDCLRKLHGMGSHVAAHQLQHACDRLPW